MACAVCLFIFLFLSTPTCVCTHIYLYMYICMYKCLLLLISMLRHRQGVSNRKERSYLPLLNAESEPRVSGTAWSAPSHYLNQCWNIVNSKYRNKFQRNLSHNLVSLKKIHLKCRLENFGHLVSSSMC